MKQVSIQVIVFLVCALLLLGCQKGKDTTKESSTDSVSFDNSSAVGNSLGSGDNDTTDAIQSQGETTNDQSEVENNGTNFVKYGDNIYYWNYYSGSFIPTGLWQTYEPQKDTLNNMICRYPDGKAAILFSLNATGPIYILTNRFFLTEPGESINKIYSVNFKGEDKKDYGAVNKICAVDEQNGLLLCLGDDNNSLSLYTINAATGEKTVLSDRCGQFLKRLDDVIYFTEQEGEYSDATYRLCSIHMDGSKFATISQVESTADKYPADDYHITDFDIVDDTIYYLFGGYAGTGYMFQGGYVASVKKDGSDYKKAVDDINSDQFYIKKSGSDISIYINKSDVLGDGITAYQSDETTQNIEFNIQKVGILFNEENQISIYQDHSGEKSIVVKDVNYSLLGITDAEAVYQVNRMDILEGWVYYTLEASKYNPDASIGWRDGYTRLKSMVVRAKVDTDEKEVLYEY